MSPVYSIIVPVYNAEPYLDRCVDSILCQGFANFELLLIDDGSTDSSCAMCDGYAIKDDRVRVFHQENGGVSTARNLGLDNSNGTWVLFVDADDYFCSSDCLSILSKTLGAHPDCELVYFAGKVVSNDGEWPFSLCSDVYEHAYQCLEANCLVPKSIVFGSVFVQCFKRSVIEENHMRFDDTISYAEDRLFVCAYYLNAGKTVVLPEVLYAYVVNEGSLMHDKKRKLRLDSDQQKSIKLIEAQMLKKKKGLPHLKKYIHGLYIQSLSSIENGEIDWRFLFRNASTFNLLIKDIMMFMGINKYK